MDENQQNQNEHVYSTVAKNPYLLPEPKKKSRIPWIIGIVIAILVSFGLGIGFCLWVLRDAPAPAPVETAPGTQMADTAAHITDADMTETHGKPQDPPEDVTPEDATEPPVDPSVTGLPEGSVQTSPEPETPPTPDDPVDPESTHISDTPVEPETPPKPDNPIDPETTACAHEYSDWQITAPATCTGAGLQTQSCQLCGEVRKEPIEPTGHTETILPGITPSCSRPGLTEGKRCEVCGDTLVEPEQLPQLNHTEVEVPAVAPTCTDHGYTAGMRCTECGVMVVEQEIVPAKGHTPGEWIIDQEPELGIEGSRHTTCTVCGAAIDETIEMLYSQGLRYSSNNNGTCSVSGVGTCRDTTIVIPPTHDGMSVIGIGYRAFGDYSAMTNIVIPESVKSIGSQAFENTSLISIVIPKNVTDIGSHAFNFCLDLATITVVPNNAKYCSVDGVLYSKDMLTLIECPCAKDAASIPEGVTSIADYAFSNCHILNSVIIPDSVTSIGDSAFQFCSGLTSIHIPDGVTSIGDCAFIGCSGLTFIEIPNGVTNIGNSAFSSCSGLTSIEIPGSVTSIGKYAFHACENLTSIEIPNGVMNIGELTFYMCTSLTKISIPDSVTSIGDRAFQGAGLIEITIPEHVTSLGDEIFINCSDLTSITVDESNPNYCSFDGVLYSKDLSILIECPDAKETVTIPNGVITIKNYAFQQCEITSIVIPNGVTSIGENAFHYCLNLISVTIPDSVTYIGNNAFSFCRMLSSITIPDSMTSISDDMFSNCSGLTSIIIPRTVTSIGYYSFLQCWDLTDIYYTGTEDEWNAIPKDFTWDHNTPNYTLHYNYTPNPNP